MQDTYWSTPQGTYDERRQLYLEYCASQPGAGWLGRYARIGFFSQIAKLELNRGPVDEEAFREAIAFVDSRQDCCDFSVGGLLRVLYLYHDSPLLSRQLVADIEDCVLRFKFWWDEEAGDNRRCYWTENHQIIFHSDELLAAAEQLDTDEIADLAPDLPQDVLQELLVTLDFQNRQRLQSAGG